MNKLTYIQNSLIFYLSFGPPHNTMKENKYLFRDSKAGWLISLRLGIGFLGSQLFSWVTDHIYTKPQNELLPDLRVIGTL